MIENWLRWEPLEGLTSQYSIDMLTDSKNLEIVLNDPIGDSSQVRITFYGSLYAYRYSDAALRGMLLFDLDQKHKGTNYTLWTFFTVENSMYIQWLSEQSYDFTENFPFKHYALVTDDGILDVVTRFEPKVEFLDK